MNAWVRPPQSAAGARWSLDGDNIVRVAYLDEAGRSRREPIIVVAGFIMHGDREYRRLVDALHGIMLDVIPEADWPGFAWHATHLYSGGGYFKDRDAWPLPKRMEILKRLSEIPARIDFPVLFGHLNKAEARDLINDAFQTPDVDAHRIDIAEHTVAFSRAEVCIEMRMRQYPRDEICMLFAEDTDRVKRVVKDAHIMLRSQQYAAQLPDEKQDIFPIRKIVDTVHFATKQDSKPLQMADLCAFLIMRRLMRRPETQECFECLIPQLSFGTPDFGAPMGDEPPEFELLKP